MFNTLASGFVIYCSEIMLCNAKREDYNVSRIWYNKSRERYEDRRSIFKNWVTLDFLRCNYSAPVVAAEYFLIDSK